MIDQTSRKGRTVLSMLINYSKTKRSVFDRKMDLEWKFKGEKNEKKKQKFKKTSCSRHINMVVGRSQMSDV